MDNKEDLRLKANEPCRRRAIWALQSQETDHGKDETVQTPPVTLQEVSKYACVKCGKEYRRGMYFHAKYCKG